MTLRRRRVIVISAAALSLLLVSFLVVRWRGARWLSETTSPTWARTLLFLGVDPNESIMGYGPPLERHAANGNHEIVRILLEAGADTEWRSKHRWTPLFTAVHGGHLRTVETLLDHGADVNAEGDCRTPYQLAIQYRHDSIARLLVARGARTEPVDCR